jgi:hypothetical protein
MRMTKIQNTKPGALAGDVPELAEEQISMV